MVMQTQRRIVDFKIDQIVWVCAYDTHIAGIGKISHVSETPTMKFATVQLINPYHDWDGLLIGDEHFEVEVEQYRLREIIDG